MTIDDMISDVLRRENGYVNHPADRGGPTKYGITAKTLGEWRGGPVSSRDVKELTEAEARSIYRARYYRQPGIDRLPESIQPFAFDCAVHHGPRRAIIMVQQACSELGFDPGPIDGVIGPRTIAAANKAAFLKGWLNRLKDFEA